MYHALPHQRRSAGKTSILCSCNHVQAAHCLKSVVDAILVQTLVTLLLRASTCLSGQCAACHHAIPFHMLQESNVLPKHRSQSCKQTQCHAVGQFKELVESSETDQPLQETLKKVLNFTSNGWHKAREHAMRAVSTDNRMRAWCADDSLEDGLLFKCYLGRVDLEAPVGEHHIHCVPITLPFQIPKDILQLFNSPMPWHAHAHVCFPSLLPASHSIKHYVLVNRPTLE